MGDRSGDAAGGTAGGPPPEPRPDARARMQEAAEVAKDRVADVRERAADAAATAKERVHEVAETARRRRIDMPWSRSLPARMVRGVVQRGVLVPALSFISPVNVIGKRNLRTLKGPAMFIANHQSHFDAPVCLSALGGKVRKRLVIAAAADYFYKSDMVGAAASVALGTVPFHRSGGLSRSSLELLKSLAGEGWSVLMFPSGTRGVSSVTGFKKGFAYVAVDKQIPVVPIYLHGLDEVMPKGAWVPLPGGVAVGIGTPIPPGDDYDDLVRRAEAAMLGVQALVRRWEAA